MSHYIIKQSFETRVVYLTNIMTWGNMSVPVCFKIRPYKHMTRMVFTYCSNLQTVSVGPKTFILYLLNRFI